MDFADAILPDADVNSQEVAEPAASGAPGAPVADPCDGGRLLQLAPASPAAGGGEDDLGQSVASAGGRGRGRGRGRGQGATRRYTLQEISAKARAARAGAALKRVRSEALQEMALQANEVNRHGNLRAGVEMKGVEGEEWARAPAAGEESRPWPREMADDVRAWPAGHGFFNGAARQGSRSTIPAACEDCFCEPACSRQLLPKAADEVFGASPRHVLH